MQELTLCYHKNSKRTVLFWKGNLLSLHMAKTGYKFFFQSKVTVNLVWHGFRHIFADFLLMSAKFRKVKILFGQKMKVYMMINVPANFHLIWTKNKEIAGGGSK